jgi:hypothetical protein
MVLRLPLSACECTCPGKNLKGLLGKKNLSLSSPIPTLNLSHTPRGMGSIYLRTPGVNLFDCRRSNPASSQSSAYRIVESVTPVPNSNSCPFTVFPTITQETSTVFSVGADAVLDDNSNKVYPSIPNAFYDELSVRDSTSDLPTSTPQCQATATHKYYCAGVLLGTYTDTTTITHGTQSDGQPASIVTTNQQ